MEKPQKKLYKYKQADCSIEDCLYFSKRFVFANKKCCFKIFLLTNFAENGAQAVVTRRNKAKP